jgi:hypothetical protein
MSNEQANDWISVQDQKPEQGVDVLISGLWYSDKAKRYYAVAHWSGSDWMDDDYESSYEPTHWRTLPPGPEAAQD